MTFQRIRHAFVAIVVLVTLMAGFTTVQSIGSPQDVDVRAAIARGVLPGPRLLTSIRPINENTGSPDAIRRSSAR